MGGSCTQCHTAAPTGKQPALEPLTGRGPAPSGADNLQLQQWFSTAALDPAAAQGGSAAALPLVAAARSPEPEAGSDVMTFRLGRPATVVISSSPAFTRRKVAELIGSVGVDLAREAVSAVEQIGALNADRKIIALAAVMRAQFDVLELAWRKFSADVRNAATARLKINHKALGEWRQYVETLAHQSLHNQSLAAQEMSWMQGLSERSPDRRAIGPHAVGDLAERRVLSGSPGEQSFVDDVMGSFINGGCMECHVRKSIPEYDRNVSRLDPRRTPRLSRMLDAAALEASNGPSPTPRVLDRPAQASIVPDSVWAFAQGRPGLSTMAEAAQSIAPKIMPLVAQYRVVPADVLRSALRPEQLRERVLAAIDQRRSGYLWMQDELCDDNYDFLQLLPVVDAFAPMVDADVRLMVRSAQARSAAAKRALTGMLEVGGVIAFLLTIFPPTAALGIALGVGVAVGGVAQGYLDWQQGHEYLMGTGAQIFSAEQEAAAGMMMASGMMSMAMNAFTVLLTPLSLAKGALASSSSAARRAALAARSQAAPEVNAVWQVIHADPVTGQYVLIGRNVAQGSAGEVVSLSVNVKTGMGSATLQGPAGSVTAPIVNGRLQFSAGMLPEGGSVGGAMVHVPGAPASVAPGAAADALPPGVTLLPAGEGPSMMRAYLPKGQPATAASRPHLGSTNIVPSDAPPAGQAPVFSMPLGPDGQGGVRLMNRGMRPQDLGNNGALGSTLADDALHLQLWTRAEATAARSPKMNAYRRWQAAMRDGSVHTWSNKELGKAFAVVRRHYMKLAEQHGLDVATIHHWNYNKNLFPEQIVDPRNLVPVYGEDLLQGGYHVAHQDGLHRLMKSGHPTVDPVAPIHVQPLYNYDVPRLNTQFPQMPEGWHPPMVSPDEMPFGWNPYYPPKYDWPGGVVPMRPAR